MSLDKFRREYHENICNQILGYRGDVPNIADKASKRSTQLAQGILTGMGFSPCPKPPVG